MNTEKKFGFLSSSEDPQKLGDTVKGLIIGFGAFLIAVLNYYGIEISNAQVTELAIEVGATISAIWTAYGLVKKLVIYGQSIFHR